MSFVTQLVGSLKSLIPGGIELSQNLHSILKTFKTSKDDWWSMLIDKSVLILLELLKDCFCFWFHWFPV